MTAPSPQSLVEHALATSAADECIAIVRSSASANLRWANNTLTTNGAMHDTSVTVISFVRRADGTAVGSVSGSATSRDRVTALVEAADAAARAGSPAEDVADLVEGGEGADWQDEPGSTSITVYDRFAPALGDAFAKAESESRILYGFVNHEVATTYLGSSTGLRLRHEQPTGHYGCTGKTADLTQSAWVGGATRDFADVDAAAMDATLAQRLSWATRRVDLPAGRYDTILPPAAMADLMIDAYWGAGARVAHEGQSVFSKRGGGTRIGEQLMRSGVHLFSDPGYPALGCAPFTVASSSGNVSSVFDNGLPLAPTSWVEDGRLTSLIQTRHSAELTGQPVTPGIDNLILTVDGAGGDTMDLVAGTERGLLLTCLWYIREVDPQTMLLTGITRDGVYLVENGEITGAVNNFRFNESPIDLLNRFTHASATVPSFSREWGDDYFSRTATPALRVPDFNMSSVSQAL
jgi:predicted Zn-dependent protease